MFPWSRTRTAASQPNPEPIMIPTTLRTLAAAAPALGRLAAQPLPGKERLYRHRALEAASAKNDIFERGQHAHSGTRRDHGQ